MDKKLITKFKKAKSLIDKVISMHENDEKCLKIVQQNLAIIGLLKSAQSQLLENEINTCINQAINTKSCKDREDLLKEILKINNTISKK